MCPFDNYGLVIKELLCSCRVISLYSSFGISVLMRFTSRLLKKISNAVSLFLGLEVDLSLSLALYILLLVGMNSKPLDKN